MTKSQLNVRASALTRKQLAELIKLWGMSQTEVVSTVIDRAYREEISNMRTRSFADGNRTRGDFGVEPKPERVIWDAEIDSWRRATDDDPERHCSWGCWDPDHGWIAPWPNDDVIPSPSH